MQIRGRLVQNTTLAALMLAFLVSGRAPATRAATQTAQASSFCPAYLLIDARGSGESGFSAPGEEFAQDLRPLLGPGQLSATPVQYAAVGIAPSITKALRALIGLSLKAKASAIADVLNGVGAITRLSGLGLGAYHESVVKGKASLKTQILDFERRCDTTRILLSGYSQGAQVTGDVYSSLTSGQRSQILGVILFGDPTYNQTSFAAQASRRHHGVLGKRPEFPSDGRERIVSYCHGHDPVCQGLTQIVHLFGDHNNYDKKGEPANSVSFLSNSALGERFCGGMDGSDIYIARGPATCDVGIKVIEAMSKLPQDGNAPGSPDGWTCYRLTGGPYGAGCDSLSGPKSEIHAFTGPIATPNALRQCTSQDYAGLDLSYAGVTSVETRGFTCDSVAAALQEWVQMGRSFAGPVAYSCRYVVQHLTLLYTCKRASGQFAFRFSG